MKTAEANLETAANINYVYLSAQGSNATSSNTNSIFNISPATSYEECPMPDTMLSLFSLHIKDQAENMSYSKPDGIKI